MLHGANRREFLRHEMAALAGMGMASVVPIGRSWAAAKEEPLFKISLAEWSLHRALSAGKMSNLDFPGFTKDEFGIDAVEFVNRFFRDKAKDVAYLKELKQRCDGAGVRSLLIMIDDEGDLGEPEEAARQKAVENHYKWVEAAKFLGCHAIRVNARSVDRLAEDEQAKLTVDGLRRLSEFGARHEINVIVENHGGLSSNGSWLAGVIDKVGMDNCGTLPDFGNFCISRQDGKEIWYDRYRGVQELMPFAKAVSAKSKEFDAEGNEVVTDYFRMMAIVLSASYRGYVGIEWEGKKPGEVEGIRLTQRLLERVREELA